MFNFELAQIPQENVIAIIFVITYIILYIVASILSKNPNKINIPFLKNLKQNQIFKKLEKIVLNAVIETNQTYVNSLKEQGSFSLEAQKIAFEKTKNAVLTTISHNLMDSLIHSDEIINFDDFLNTMIESCVSKCKNKKE